MFLLFFIFYETIFILIIVKANARIFVFFFKDKFKIIPIYSN